jgi:hypothetical protein
MRRGNNALKATLLSSAIVAASGSAISAEAPKVRMFDQGTQRCIETNGVPNHSIGAFPNRGNPNSLSVQQGRYCFDLAPERKSPPTHGAPTVGIALNGIVMRPGTAEWYDASSRRGFSRDQSSGWNLEGMWSGESLGMDQNNAHVAPSGLYHYHGKPVGLLKVNRSTHIGYAADGFEIHYVGASAKSSWKLKSGQRATAPGGRHDGKFVQDWMYAANSGNLDECNGGLIKGKYVYFSTDSFPFYPRCHWGDVSADFGRGGERQRAGASTRQRPNGERKRGGGGRLPLRPRVSESLNERCETP